MKTMVPILMALLVASPSFAGKPTSIKYIEDIVLPDEKIYSYYLVSCSDGKTADLSAWDNRKQWCQGKGNRDDASCTKKQIKAAKLACK